MTTVKFVKASQDTRLTTLTSAQITLQQDSISFVSDTLYQQCLAQLPAILANTVTGVTKDPATSDADYSRIVTLIAQANRADFAINLDTIFRKIGIMYPKELDMLNMSVDEKIEFFVWLSSVLTELNASAPAPAA